MRISSLCTKPLWVFLLILSLCMTSCRVEYDTELNGYLYINQDTSNSIKFDQKNKIVFEWKSDDSFWGENSPHEYYYWIDDANNIHLGGFATTGEAFNFPYNKLQFIDSRQAVVCTNRKGVSVIYRKLGAKTDLD